VLWQGLKSVCESQELVSNLLRFEVFARVLVFY
jgi:hypothetical protein